MTFLALLLLAVGWCGMGVIVASFYANLYAFMNFESPPSWKVWMVIFIWPISIFGMVWDKLSRYKD